MPLPVTAWGPGNPLDSKSLNLACYTLDGQLNHPAGILFSARPPMTLEVLDTAVTFTSSPAGHRSVIDQSGSGHYDATQIVDNAGYYGQTCDGTFISAAYHMTPVIYGSAGDGVTPGGMAICGHFIPLTPSATMLCAGADMDAGGTLVSSGSRQKCVLSAHDNTPFFLDLLDTTGTTLQPSVYIADSASNSVSADVNNTDSSGNIPRFFTLWAGAAQANSAAYGTPALPAPYGTWTGATTVGTSSAATVNVNAANGPKGTLDFLASPPLFRAAIASTQAVPINANTKVSLSGATVYDPYGGFAHSSYTVQRPGLYLAHALAAFNPGGGNVQAGISVNGTIYWGPGYPAPFNVPQICATKTQIFSLQAGDVVSLFVTADHSGNALEAGDLTRIFLAWLCAGNGPPATSWVPPDLSFRWAAGTAAAQMPALLQTHLGNDLNWLVNRPYLMAYQTSANSGIASSTFAVPTLGSVSGIVHGDNGDSYSGWVSGASNRYIAPEPGWYMAVLEGFFTFPTATSVCMVEAAFNVPSSGGRTPLLGPDEYQHMIPPFNSTTPGSTAVGLYYLNAGESIQPQLRAQDWGANWGTTAAAGMNSHLEIVWVSE